jgi:hypothetical protein
MRDKSKMRYRGECVGGPRDGETMVHDHRERIEHELLNNTFIVTGGPSFDEQWPRIGKYVYDARHEPPRWHWIPDEKTS